MFIIFGALFLVFLLLGFLTDAVFPFIAAAGMAILAIATGFYEFLPLAAGIIPWVIAHPFHIIGGSILYFVIGTIYMIWKWSIFVDNSYDLQVSLGYKEKKAPKVSENKARLSGWILWWPLSAPWTIINEPIRKILNWIYDTCKNALQGIADRRFSK